MNVEKTTSFHRWNNVDEHWQSALIQRLFNVDVFAGGKD